MGKYLSITILLFTLFSCGETIQINKSELNHIYDDILSTDSLTRKYYLLDSIDKFETKAIKQSDTTYFIADYGGVENGVWTDKIHDSLVIITEERLNSISKADPFPMTLPHYRFSLPYFSKDKQSFIIYYDHYCGSLCAEYSLRLYKLIDGKWTFVKSYFSLIS